MVVHARLKSLFAIRPDKGALLRVELQNVLESGIDERVRPSLSSWEDAYKTVPPWDVGRPQPAFVELVKAGELNSGSVLDVGCGTGENALYLAGNGFSVTGVDLTSRAIAAARAKAAERKQRVDFRIR